jgi:hypothetical protein
MKTLIVRLPETLIADIEAESRHRNVSKSHVVRERLQTGKRSKRQIAHLEVFADLIGSVDGLPVDLSSSKKQYLQKTGYGKKRSR